MTSITRNRLAGGAMRARLALVPGVLLAPGR
jgi:hypothetical protein